MTRKPEPAVWTFWGCVCFGLALIVWGIGLLAPIDWATVGTFALIPVVVLMTGLFVFLFTGSVD